ncbi:ATP-binding protein [Geodermatophilus aquaeductus]|uniref:Transcriptional regulatory protein, C terminal n=1 Tax=Geodermatophilus aquaeductus TaxID=1564161 RepID=A0A521DPU7_9ACTN|nr:winged helix-turn-helix domain-containing protein [Geodermatophilus aquaeductus]SMO73658.1 Transcriptional regulatory protein, C terminal [Geodermatophilus aquaeductus]
MGTATRSRSAALLGRGSDVETLMASVHAGGVTSVHGLPGIGKSALLDAVRRRADDEGATVLALDCRTVEPTERGFLAAAGGATDLGGFVGALESAAPAVLLLDQYEHFLLLDSWLRRTLVPALPAGTALVMAGRGRPVPGWLAVPGFSSVLLGPLADVDARALLAGRGVPADEAARLNRIARGHPLALVLASAGVAENPQLGLEDAAMSRVVEELARLYREDVDDPLTRRALDAASVVRRTTESLMDAMLGGDGAAALDRLLALPFVVAGRDGTLVHEAVRDAVAGHLRSTHPVRYRDLRRAAWRQLRDETRAAAPAELWTYTADTLYLLDNPVVRDAFFPSDVQQLAVEPATSGDGPAIGAMARRHEGPAAARLLARWWTAAPSSFSVSRDRDGTPAGAFLLLGDAQIRHAPVDDPVVAAWSRQLQCHPLARGEVALGLRRWLDRDRGEAPGPPQAACWLDTKRTYMALRPALRRMFVVVRDVPSYWPVVRELGFRPVPSATVVLDGEEWSTVLLDFGPGSVDGWLADLLAAELGVADEPALDDGTHELVVGGAPVALTPLEYGLFRQLREHEGHAVTRPELLDRVWGTADAARGSNVVDAVVRTLRAKLGPGASAIEAIRGSGYRLRGDWRTRLR